MSVVSKIEKKKHQEILEYLGAKPMFTSETVVFDELGNPQFTGELHIYLNKRDFEMMRGIKFADSRIFGYGNGVGVLMNIVKKKGDKIRALKMASKASTLDAFLKRFRKWKDG